MEEVLRSLPSLPLPISPHPSTLEFLDLLESEWKETMLEDEVTRTEDEAIGMEDKVIGMEEEVVTVEEVKMVGFLVEPDVSEHRLAYPHHLINKF